MVVPCVVTPAIYCRYPINGETNLASNQQSSVLLIVCLKVLHVRANCYTFTTIHCKYNVHVGHKSAQGKK